MSLPGETEAGTAGTQPCRGIAWWAHRDDDRQRRNRILALLQTLIGSKAPDALKIPPKGGIPTESPLSIEGEPTHFPSIGISPRFGIPPLHNYTT